MSDKKWTPQQRHCIEAHGGTLLVSAAAGSGKTSVLIERIAARVTDDKHPVDIDKLLVVTFTKAAAAEMKQRLSLKFSELLAQRPADLRLQHQQILLPHASICTVDSFCSSLIRDNFHQLGISPQFKVAEQQPLLLLRKQSLTEALNEFYKEKHPDFLELTAMLTNGKNDSKLTATVEKIYDFIQSHPSPDDWLNQTAALYDTTAPLFDTVWGEKIYHQAKSSLVKASTLYQKAMAIAQSETDLAEKHYPAIAADYAAVLRLSECLEEKNWDSFFALLSAFSSTSLSPVRKCQNEAAKKQAAALRGSAADCIKTLQTLACGTEELCRQDIQTTKRLVQTLYRIVRRFSAIYGEKKQQQNLMDFSDIEHYALQLLTTQDENGNRIPTAIAKELSSQYEEILVDEYQDTNAVQDALFSALSRDETNLFFVGDVKQSIYGFRQAMPELFVGRRDRYAPFEGNNYPATITLGNNFRSRREVTDAVNCVFRQLWGESIGGIQYNENEALIPTASYPESEDFAPELLLADSTQYPDTDKDTLEAAIIADRISQMVGTLSITLKDGTRRPLQYGDCCILLRNRASHAATYRTVLENRGISAVSEAETGFFGTAEICLALSLLRCIDNPLQDIPLTAVLLSALFSFTPDDLATIRLHRKDCALYTALLAARQSDDTVLAQKCGAFLQTLTRYRTLATTLSVDRLVQRLYEDFSLPELYGARKQGRRRRENLRLLHEQCARFEQNGFRGLSAFVRYVDRLQVGGADLPAASLNAGAENAVSIISIHGSKGLEFPVVFLAGLRQSFNQKSLQEDLLLHPTLGAGIKRRDAKTFNVYKTISHQGVSLALRNHERAEELRVLYVAMTRAKEKLCLVFVDDHLQKKMQRFCETLDFQAAMSSDTVLGASSMGQWLLCSLLRLPRATALRETFGLDNVPLIDDTTVWDIRLPLPLLEESATAENEIAAVAPDEELVRQIRENMAYTYPHEALTHSPAKVAASELARQTTNNPFVATARPKFMSGFGLTPAERGTAMHAFMQFAEYTAAAASLTDEVERLTALAFLSKEQAESLDKARLRAFFESDLYERMSRASRCLREYHFTFRQPTDTEYLKASAVVQGIADCVFEEEDGLVVVDYKTDHVKTAETLVERYAAQLNIYREALQTIFQKPVKECLLYSFSLNTTVRVE